MSRSSLLDHFSALDDPRQRGKMLCPLPEIMLLVLCATLAGAEDFVEIRHLGLQKLDFLRGLLPFARGIPSRPRRPRPPVRSPPWPKGNCAVRSLYRDQALDEKA